MTYGEMTRGQWQAHEGSELFGTYYRMLTEESPPESLRDFANWEPVSLDQIPIMIGKLSAERLLGGGKESAANRLLVDHKDALNRYTDVDTFMNVSEGSFSEAIYSHTYDGIFFAHAATMGIVVETLTTANMWRQMDQRGTLRATETLLRNKNLEHVLRPLALTGFAILKASGQPETLVGQTGLQNIQYNLDVLHIDEPIWTDREVGRTDDLSTIDIQLHPRILAVLREQLMRQNRQVKEGTHTGNLRMAPLHVGKPGFSSGCPVAHNDETFGLMRNYLAETTRLTAEAEQLVSA